MRLVMAVSKPWPEKLCGIPKIPNMKTTRIPTMSANFQRRFLFITNRVQRFENRRLLLGLCFLFLSRNLRNRCLGNFHSQVVRRNPQMERVVLQSNDGSLQSAAGYNPVAGFQ